MLWVNCWHTFSLWHLSFLKCRPQEFIPPAHKADTCVPVGRDWWNQARPHQVTWEHLAMPPSGSLCPGRLALLLCLVPCASDLVGHRHGGLASLTGVLCLWGSCNHLIQLLIFQLQKWTLWDVLRFVQGRTRVTTKSPEASMIGCLSYLSFILFCFLKISKTTEHVGIKVCI